MQALKIFIVIEGDSGKDELRIDGNLETLRAFLSGVGSFEMQSAPLQSFPAVDPSPIMPKRKSNKRKETLSPLTA